MKRIVKKTFLILGSFLFLLFSGLYLITYHGHRIYGPSPDRDLLVCTARGGDWHADANTCSCGLNDVPSNTSHCTPYLRWRSMNAWGFAYGECVKSGRQDVEEESEYKLQLRPLDINSGDTLPENLPYRPERLPVICGKGQPDTAVIIMESRVIYDDNIYPIYISSHDPALSVVRLPVGILAGQLKEFRPENTQAKGEVEVPLEKFIEFFQEPENLIPGTMLE